jgi:hypothetical protein
MKWPWRYKARPIEPRRAIDSSMIELETAKEIPAEVFHARPGEVEKMIQRRLEERRWDTEESYCLIYSTWVSDYGTKF